MQDKSPKVRSMESEQRTNWVKIPWIRAEVPDASEEIPVVPEGACVDEWCVKWYERIGEYPSVRDVFYAGIDIYWPGTISAYKTMDKWLTRLREEGRFPVEYLRDGGKRELEDPEHQTRDPDAYIDGLISDLREDIITILTGKPTYYFGRWYKQPKKIYVVGEKEGDMPHIRHICEPLGVSVAYIKGFSSVPLHKAVAEKMKSATKEGRTNILLFVGDFDPSGRKIRRSFAEKLRKWGAVFEELTIAVTHEQVMAFNLPCIPQSKKEQEKFMRQHEAQEWIAEYKEPIRVETASFRNREPDAFEQCVRDGIRPHYHEGIREQVRQLAECNAAWMRYRLEQFREPANFTTWIQEVTENATGET